MPRLATPFAVLTAAAAHHCRRPPAIRRKAYDPGASDTEIKVGNIMLFGAGVVLWRDRQTEAAFFNMINAQGGINGRKINFISYDDGYCAEGDRTGASW